MRSGSLGLCNLVNVNLNLKVKLKVNLICSLFKLDL